MREDDRQSKVSPAIELVYLAREGDYSSRRGALGSLRHFPLPPSEIYEVDEGFIFSFYVWPPSLLIPNNYWLPAKKRGVRIAYTGESYSRHDLIAAAIAPKQFTARVMRYVYEIKATDKYADPRREIFFRMGFSKNGSDSMYRWMPIGQDMRFGDYPFYLLTPIDMDNIIHDVLENKSIYRIQGTRISYFTMEDIRSAYPFADNGDPMILPWNTKQYYKPPIMVWGRKFFGVDTQRLPARGEGGYSTRQIA